MPSENAERNRVAFLKEPCDECTAESLARILAKFENPNALLMLDAKRAARYDAIANCRHRLDLDAVMSAHVPLEDIFAIGHPFGESVRKFIDDLGEAIGAGFVSLSRHVMPVLPRLDNYDILNQFSGRSVDHKIICAQCAIWLGMRGRKYAVDLNALRYVGGIADVMASDRSIACEAGYTDAHKVLRAMDAEIAVLVAPYTHETGLPIDVGFLFEPVRKRPVQDPYKNNATKGLL